MSSFLRHPWIRPYVIGQAVLAHPSAQLLRFLHLSPRARDSAAAPPAEVSALAAHPPAKQSDTVAWALAEISDNQHFVKAVFTPQAIRSFAKKTGQSIAEIKGGVMALKTFRKTTLANCDEFLVVVDDFNFVGSAGSDPFSASLHDLLGDPDAFHYLSTLRQQAQSPASGAGPDSSAAGSDGEGLLPLEAAQQLASSVLAKRQGGAAPGPAQTIGSANARTPDVARAAQKPLDVLFQDCIISAAQEEELEYLDGWGNYHFFNGSEEMTPAGRHGYSQFYHSHYSEGGALSQMPESWTNSQLLSIFPLYQSQEPASANAVQQPQSEAIPVDQLDTSNLAHPEQPLELDVPSSGEEAGNESGEVQHADRPINSGSVHGSAVAPQAQADRLAVSLLTVSATFADAASSEQSTTGRGAFPPDGSPRKSLIEQPNAEPMAVEESPVNASDANTDVRQEPAASSAATSDMSRDEFQEGQQLTDSQPDASLAEAQPLEILSLPSSASSASTSSERLLVAESDLDETDTVQSPRGRGLGIEPQVTSTPMDVSAKAPSRAVVDTQLEFRKLEELKESFPVYKKATTKLGGKGALPPPTQTTLVEKTARAAPHNNLLASLAVKRTVSARAEEPDPDSGGVFSDGFAPASPPVDPAQSRSHPKAPPASKASAESSERRQPQAAEKPKTSQSPEAAFVKPKLPSPQTPSLFSPARKQATVLSPSEASSPGSPEPHRDSSDGAHSSSLSSMSPPLAQRPVEDSRRGRGSLANVFDEQIVLLPSIPELFNRHTARNDLVDGAGKTDALRVASGMFQPFCPRDYVDW